MIFLKDTDRVALNKTFINSADYSERTKSHIPLLFDKNFNLTTISIIYNISIKDIYILLKFIEYFGLKDYLTLDFEILSQRVKNEDYRVEIEKNQEQEKKFFYYALWPFTTVYYFFENLIGVGYAFLAYLISWFSPRNTSNTINKNSVNIQKGASRNKIMQITNLIIVNGTTSEKQKESIVTHSEDDIIKEVEKLIASDDDYSFGNDFADRLFQKAKNVNQDKSIPEESKLRKIRWYATLIVFLLLYSTTFKGGISTITILGIVIAVSFKGCFSNSPGNVLNTLSSDKSVSKTIFDSSTLKPGSDSINLDKKNEEQTINNYATYEKEVLKYFEHDANCFSLCGIGQRQRRFIEKLDKVNHLEQDYCISQPDDFYYVHVVAYNNVNEAVFQMHYINENTDFKAKVLQTFTNKGLLYAVIIGKFTGDDVSAMCQLVSEWKSKCLSSEAEIGCFYNGI